MYIIGLYLHNQVHIVLVSAGKVYNMTPYMKFHPGGVEELMRGAGKDCTILFNEVRDAIFN